MFYIDSIYIPEFDLKLVETPAGLYDQNEKKLYKPSIKDFMHINVCRDLIPEWDRADIPKLSASLKGISKGLIIKR